MINFLAGKYENNSLILSNGIGYEVNHPYTNLSGDISLFVITIVRENDIKLYGFKTQDERLLFKALLQVTKVGPSVAINMFRAYDYKTLYLAIKNKDTVKLSAIKGLGKQLIEQILLTIKLPVSEIEEIAQSLSHLEEQVDVLVMLGYAKKDVLPILEQKYQELTTILEVDQPNFEEELIKLTLEGLRRE